MMKISNVDTEFPLGFQRKLCLKKMKIFYACGGGYESKHADVWLLHSNFTGSCTNVFLYIYCLLVVGSATIMDPLLSSAIKSMWSSSYYGFDGIHD